MGSKMVLMVVLVVTLATTAVLLIVNPGRFGRSRLYAGGGEPRAQNEDKERSAFVERLGNAPDVDVVRRIQFIDEHRGWVSDRQRIWRTTDGGKSWHLIYESPADSIWEMQFVTASKGWIDVLGKMYSSADGGETWVPYKQPISPYPDGDLATFHFVGDGSAGWVIGGIYRTILSTDKTGPPPRYARPGFEDQGRVGVIFFTGDCGKTWQRQFLTSSWGYLWNIFAGDTKHAWVTGIPGEFYFEQGRWRRIGHGGTDQYGDFHVKALNLALGGPNEEPSCIFFLNQYEGWICNFNGYLAKSVDGGRTWEDLFVFDKESQTRSYFCDIYFNNSNDGWALSHQGDLYRTSDGGRHWSKVNTGIKAAAMFFIRPDYGFIIARNGLFRLM